MFERISTKRNTSANECAFKVATGRYAQTAAIQCGTTATASGKFFAFDRVDNNGVFNLAFVFASDGDREVRYPVNKIGGAIERIDNPFIIGVFARLVSAFFTANAVVGVGFTEMINNFFFSGFIDFSYIGVAAFGFDR